MEPAISGLEWKWHAEMVAENGKLKWIGMLNWNGMDCTTQSSQYETVGTENGLQECSTGSWCEYWLAIE